MLVSFWDNHPLPTIPFASCRFMSNPPKIYWLLYHHHCGNRKCVTRIIDSVGTLRNLTSDLHDMAELPSCTPHAVVLHVSHGSQDFRRTHYQK